MSVNWTWPVFEAKSFVNKSRCPESEASFWRIRQNQRIRDHARVRILTKPIVPAAAWLGISEAATLRDRQFPVTLSVQLVKLQNFISARRNWMDEWSVRLKPERRTRSGELRPQCNHSRVATLLFVRLFLTNTSGQKFIGTVWPKEATCAERARCALIYGNASIPAPTRTR